jgi:flagellar basal-body rod protein FlgC
MSDVYEIAASGMSAQRTQMNLIAENLANAGVTRADGTVFHPKVAVLETASPFEASLSAAVSNTALELSDFAFADERADEPAGVAVADIVDQEGGPQYRFDPANPFAAKIGSRKGYVMLPDVDPIGQMVALVSSGRAYDANVSMLNAAKQMDIEAAEIGRA